MSVPKIEALAWSDLKFGLQPVEPPAVGTSVQDIIGQAIDVANDSGFVWYPNALTDLAGRLCTEVDGLNCFDIDDGEQGKYQKSYVIDYQDGSALKSLRDAIQASFQKRSIPECVSMHAHTYTGPENFLATHMDKGTMASPVILTTIDGPRQPNFEVYRMPVLERFEIPTGPGDLIVQTSPNWGNAMGLFHGVLHGPRRSLVAIGQ